MRPHGLDYDPELACDHLRAAEPRLDDLIARAGSFTLRPVPTQSLFVALSRSIVYQQLSGKAAETILGRVIALYRPKRFPGPSDILETAAGAPQGSRALEREDRRHQGSRRQDHRRDGPLARAGAPHGR